MGTFRKLLLITSSRRLGVWLLSLLGYRWDNNNAMKKYSCANGLSSGKLRKVAFPNWLHFQAKVEDLHLKSSALRKTFKDKTSGETVEKVVRMNYALFSWVI
jgi:hypothetical protein